MKVLNEAVLSELQVITLEASLLHNRMQQLRERACAAIGISDDGSYLAEYLADKVQELVDVEGVDLHDVVSALTMHSARFPFNKPAATN